MWRKQENIHDICTSFVPDDNVVNRIQGEKSKTDVLDESASEFHIPNLVDQIEGEVSTMDEPVKNVDGDGRKDDTCNDVQAVLRTESKSVKNGNDDTRKHGASNNAMPMMFKLSLAQKNMINL